MNKLEGIPLTADHLDLHSHICDLISVEFPVLSLYTDGRRNWIYLWCDRDERGKHRWMIFPTSRDLLVAYLREKVTMLTLIKEAAFVWVLENSDWAYSDSNKEKQIKKAKRSLKRVALDKLVGYLPAEDSFFDPSLTDDLDLNRDLVPSNFELPIHGEWFNADFVYTLKRYERLYAFFYAARPRFVKSIELTLSRLLRSPWMGGFSRYNLFEHLWRQIPGIHSLKVEHANYASPGEFRFEAIASIGDSIRNSTLLLINKREAVEASCERMRKMLKQANLNKADLSKFTDSVIRLDDAQRQSMIDDCKSIAETLKVSDEFETLRTHSPNTVVYSKAVLSFVVQLDRFADLQRNGLLNFPSIELGQKESLSGYLSADDSDDQ
jgi:hypothetical protein